MPKTKEEEKKDKAALVILPIFLGGAAAWYFFSRKVSADPNKAILFGRVTDVVTGDPIQGVTVNCNGYTRQTNSQGEYEIINIEPATYLVQFTHQNYEPVQV